MKTINDNSLTPLTVGAGATMFPPPLTANDRCDSCQSAAYVAVALRLGKTSLLFCAHHYNKHEAKLNELGAYVHDERYRLADSEVLRKKDGVSA